MTPPCWRVIPGFRYEVNQRGVVRNIQTGLILRPQAAGSGHVRVTIGGQRLLVHRLVLLAHRGPCPPGQEGLHWNDNPTDNRLENLRWGTRSQNRLDAKRNQALRGARDRGKKLERAKVARIKTALRAGVSVTRAAQAFGISRPMVRKIRDGTCWEHVM